MATSRLLRVLALALPGLAIPILTLAAAPAAPAPSAPTPRLAVVISVDQMRADYLERFAPYFGDGGFKRLLAGGTQFTRCDYGHAYTITAPGHATILSGVNADVHGIIANDWVDRQTYLKGNAVEDTRSPLLGLPPRVGRHRNATEAAKSGRSPRNFLGTTVGDRLKARYGAAAKVYGVGDKDRSAILMAGRQADGAFWTEEGVFVTSTYYGPELPAWVREFNTSLNAAQFYGVTWDRLLPVEVYDRVQGRDDQPGEEETAGLPRTLPKRITGTGPAPTGDFFTAYDRSPWANAQVAALARRVIEVESLGQDEVPDLLAIGFSQPDATGHTYGPDSHEMMDTYLRLDRTLAELLDFLEAKVGLARCVIVLTADHGVAPLPERVVERDGPGSAGRVVLNKLNGEVTRALDAEFGPLPDQGVWFLRDGGFYVNAAALAARGVTSAQVQGVIKRVLLTQPWIGLAYTREEFTSGQPLDAAGEMARRSFHAGRSADVVFYLRRYFTTNKTGIGHGTPFDYDTHVPSVWLGAGVPRGVRSEPVHVEDIAPTLAGLLGVDLPPPVAGRRLF